MGPFEFIIISSLIVIGSALPTNENSSEPRVVTVEDSDKSVDTSEQQDPMFQGMGGMSPYGPFGGMNNMNGVGMNGYGPQENAVNFDFNCKCKAKSNLPINLQVPTDANAAAQQQIQQLQDQIRRLNEQVRRSQTGQSNFEQFAQILSMADGLDCNCSGSSAPFSGFPFSGNSQNSGNQMGQMSGGFGQQMPFMAGRGIPNMMGQRLFPGMFP